MQEGPALVKKVGPAQGALICVFFMFWNRVCIGNARESALVMQRVCLGVFWVSATMCVEGSGSVLGVRVRVF